MSVSILFFHRQGKWADSQTSVYCRITKDNKRADYKTEIKIKHDLWDDQLGGLKGFSDDAVIMNRMLTQIKSKIYAIIADLEITGEHVTPKRIRYELNGGARKNTSNSIINLYRKEIERRKNSTYALASVKKMQSTLNNMRLFLNTAYKVHDVLIADVDYAFIKKFEEWAFFDGEYDGVKKVGWKRNYFISELLPLRKILSEAFKSGLIKSYPFVGYSLKKQKSVYKYLTQEEVAKIEALSIPKEESMLCKSRDLFVFSCYTGLSFVDLKNLSKDQIISHPTAGLCISKQRQKTKTDVFIPIIPKAKFIYDKHLSHGDYVFDMPTYNAYRDCLISIQELTGIDKNIRSHVGRHTAATYLLNAGIPEESVCRALGISSVSVLRNTYGKLLNDTVAKHFKLLETA